MKKALLLVVLSCSTALGGDLHLALPYTRFTLPNGLEVILREDHAVPTVAVNLWYHVGSSRETPGHTGFAHLFEHLMFMGSKNAPEGKFDEWLEAAGGDNNASTTTDRTDYYENVPSNALELPLFLESDRMATLSEVMTPEKVDAQRAVVKNERRETVENRPYGQASIIIHENLFPPEHPYHWSAIGSMDDLDAATYDDVVEFFKTYYVPGNASLVIVGDIDPVKARSDVEHWFSDVPAGEPVPPQGIPAVEVSEQKSVVFEDRVQLPRLYLAWVTPPLFAPGDAELDLLSLLLAGGKNSRLYRRLVYDLQIAQDVSAFQASSKLASVFQIIVTARSGHSLGEILPVVDEEIARLKAEGPAPREFERAVNQMEASFLDRLENVSFVADQLNAYFSDTGDPDYFNEDLSRYTAVDPSDIRSVAETFLRENGRVVLSVVPEGKRELSATKEAR